jgi:hypothetical protein
MRACEHYRPAEIEPVSNWNAYIKYPDGKSVFRPGGFIEYIAHLKDNRICRKEAGITGKYISLLIKSFDEEIDRKLASLRDEK